MKVRDKRDQLSRLAYVGVEFVPTTSEQPI